MPMSEAEREPLECYGEAIFNKGRADTVRSHGPKGLRIIEHEGEHYWTCPECGWMLKEFMGERVDDWRSESDTLDEGQGE